MRAVEALLLLALLLPRRAAERLPSVALEEEGPDDGRHVGGARDNEPCPQQDPNEFPKCCDGEIVLNPGTYNATVLILRGDCTLVGRIPETVILNKEVPLLVKGPKGWNLTLKGPLRFQGTGGSRGCIVMNQGLRSLQLVGSPGEISFRDCFRRAARSDYLAPGVGGAITARGGDVVVASGEVSFIRCGSEGERQPGAGAVFVGDGEFKVLDGRVRFMHCYSEASYSIAGGVYAKRTVRLIGGSLSFQHCRGQAAPVTANGTIRMCAAAGAITTSRDVEILGAHLAATNCSAAAHYIAAGGIMIHQRGTFRLTAGSAMFSGCQAHSVRRAAGAICTRHGAVQVGTGLRVKDCSATSRMAASAVSGANMTVRGAAFEGLSLGPGTKGGVLLVEPDSVVAVELSTFVGIASGSCIWAPSAKSVELRQLKFKDINETAVNGDVAQSIVATDVRGKNLIGFMSAIGVMAVTFQRVALENCPNLVGARPCVRLTFLVHAENFSMTDVSFVAQDKNGTDRLPSLFSAQVELAPGSALEAAALPPPSFSLACPAGTWSSWDVAEAPTATALDFTNLTTDCSWRVPGGCCSAGYLYEKGKIKSDCQNMSCTCTRSSDCKACTVITKLVTYALRCKFCYGSRLAFNGSRRKITNWEEGRNMQHAAKSVCKRCSAFTESVFGNLVHCTSDRVILPEGVMMVRNQFAETGVSAFACPNSFACPGKRFIKEAVLPEDGEGFKMCAKGYVEVSPGCTLCEKGFGRQALDPFVCQPCAPPRQHLALFVLQPTVIFCLGLWSVRAGRHQDAGSCGRRSGHILNIMMSFGTLAAAVCLAISGTETFKGMANDAQTMRQSMRASTALADTASATFAYSHDCLLRKTGGPVSINRWVLLEATMPLALLVGSLFIYCAGQASMLTVLVVLGNAFLPGLLGAVSRHFPCVQLQSNGTFSRMAYALQLECNSGDSWEATGKALAGGLACMAIGPVFWLVIIRRSQSWDPEDRSDHLGFIVNAYRPSAEWWEVTVLLRKMCLRWVQVVQPISYAPGDNINMMLSIIVASLVAHLLVQPYQDDLMNTLEGLVLAASTVLVLLTAYVTPGSPKSPLWAKRTSIGVSLLLVSVTLVGLLGLFLEYTSRRICTFVADLRARRRQREPASRASRSSSSEK